MARHHTTSAPLQLPYSFGGGQVVDDFKPGNVVSMPATYEAVRGSFVDMARRRAVVVVRTQDLAGAVNAVSLSN
jgi:hypothetical protein